ncbi:MAG: hypothetical protein WC977_15030 [Anaerovoracaceae bacterium]
MNDERRDYGEWGTDSGLPSNFDGTIIAAEFTTDEKYTSQDGSPMTVLRLEFDHAAESSPVLLSLGAGWEIADRGKRAVHANRNKFVATSRIGRWIDRCVKQLGMFETLVARGAPTVAATWEGLRFHFERETIDYGAGIGEKEMLMPTAFLGVVDGKGNVSGGTVAAKVADDDDFADEPVATTAADDASDTDTDASNPLAGIPPKVRLELKKMAKQASDSDEFQALAMDANGASEELINRILDDADCLDIYNALK